MMEERDARGWVLTGCSALACCAGASIVFIDLLPWRNFSIQSNSSFLAACLSISFSVLSFSSARLFGEAVAYLERGYGDNPYYIVMVSFSAGFLICYYLFKFLHRFIPHRTVNCDDNDEEVEEDDDDDDKRRQNGYGSSSSGATLAHQNRSNGGLSSSKAVVPDEETALLSNGNDLDSRPTFAKRLSETVGKITRRCTEDGRCLGFITCPCEGNCVHKKSGLPHPLHACQPKHCTRSYTGSHGSCTDECHSNTNLTAREIPILEDEEQDHDRHHHHSYSHSYSHGSHSHDHYHDEDSPANSQSSVHDDENGHSHKHLHHHHIADNAFVGIGFQTTLAIALHRCPDGFITFVTNHADQNLGFTIFLSLFIHSAVDGFTMCLPLYLALQSAWKAVLITVLVGGLAQPLGGLFAFIWLRVGSAPSEIAYGIVFSFTAGLMAVVAVQLLRQIPSDHRHPDLPYISMLAGGVLMFLSVALTSSS